MPPLLDTGTEARSFSVPWYQSRKKKRRRHTSEAVALDGAREATVRRNQPSPY